MKKIFLFSVTSNNDHKLEYYKSFDMFSYTNKKNMEHSEIPDRIYCSPYLSSIQLACYFSIKFKMVYNVENSLYDVLTKRKYTIHNSHHYLNSYKNFNFKSDLFNDYFKCTLYNNSKLFNTQNTYYNSSFMVSNIKFNETETDILNRLSPFLYKLLNDDSLQNIILITHPDLESFIIKYFDNNEKIKVIKNELLNK